MKRRRWPGKLTKDECYVYKHNTWSSKYNQWPTELTGTTMCVEGKKGHEKGMVRLPESLIRIDRRKAMATWKGTGNRAVHLETTARLS